MNKSGLAFLLVLFCSIIVHAQSFQGVFEKGDLIPIWALFADHATGAPADPAEATYRILKNGQTIAQGSLTPVQTGLAAGTHATAEDDPGRYAILISGLVNGVTAQILQTYDLVDTGAGPASIAAEVAGLNGLTPMTESAFVPYQSEILGWVHDSAASVTQAIAAQIEAASAALGARLGETWRESAIAARELSRARLWYAADTIDTPWRQVPADMPSHMEIDLAAPDDPLFTAPLETFFRIFYYPNATTATKASREIRSATPPADGMFYLLPDLPW
ncbi:MAG TPA: hypothetical protein PKV38_06030 [bacterium]|nr:hypothetical protein [bacterium]